MTIYYYVDSPLRGRVFPSLRKEEFDRHMRDIAKYRRLRRVIEDHVWLILLRPYATTILRKELRIARLLATRYGMTSNLAADFEDYSLQLDLHRVTALEAVQESLRYKEHQREHGRYESVPIVALVPILETTV